MIYFDKVSKVYKDNIKVLENVNFEKEAYVPGEMFGLPENCYPESGGEININSLTLIEDPKGKKIKRNFNDFIDDLYESIIEQLED